MFTKLFLLIFITSSSFTLGINNSTTTCNHDATQNKEQVVKAIQYNGEFIPSIELDEVVITAKRTYDNFLKASIIDGQIVPMIELKEVVIYPSI